MNPCPHDLAERETDAADGGCSICTRLELVEAQAEVALLQKSVVQWQGRTGEAQAHVAALREALDELVDYSNTVADNAGTLGTLREFARNGRKALASNAGQKALDVVRAARRELVPTCCLEYGAPIPSSVSAAWVHPNTPTGRAICKATPERSAVLDALSEAFPGVDR